MGGYNGDFQEQIQTGGRKEAGKELELALGSPRRLYPSYSQPERESQCQSVQCPSRGMGEGGLEIKVSIGENVFPSENPGWSKCRQCCAARLW